MSTYTAVDKNGKTVMITKEICDYAENPRTFSDHFSTFYTFERRHMSPDKHDYVSAEDWADTYGFTLGNSPQELIESMEKHGYIAIPVWRYEHSGVDYTAADINPYRCSWDSCFVGVIFANKSDIREIYTVKRITNRITEKIKDIMKNEVREYSYYANGEVYEYSIKPNADGEKECVDLSYGDDAEDSIIANMCRFYGLTLTA